MSIIGVNGGGSAPTVIIGREAGRDALEARRVSTGPMALSKKFL